MQLERDACLGGGRRGLLHWRLWGSHLGRHGVGRLDGCRALRVEVRPDQADAHEGEQADGDDDSRSAAMGQVRVLQASRATKAHVGVSM